jgi:hypothetical protein
LLLLMQLPLQDHTHGSAGMYTYLIGGDAPIVPYYKSAPQCTSSGSDVKCL